MGFVLGVIYLLTYYLTPTTLFGPLAPFRIELIIAALILLVSIPALMQSFMLRTPQLLALVGLATATFMSVLIGGHWAGGAVQGFLAFIPSVFAFFVVCLHCKSKRQLQVLVLMLLFVCLFVIGRGYFDLRHVVSAAASPISGATVNAPTSSRATGSPYLMAQQSDAREWFYRLNGLGQINDPNDFAQLIVCVIPLLFIFWRPKSTLRNMAFVILPACALGFGAYLTHSRGFILSFLAMTFVAARRRIGTLPALVVAGVLFAGASALHFSGGRDISADSGSDRTALWGEGLQAFKTHPLFGVGLGMMGDYTDNAHTAHNSIVVCAAELGLFGLYFWSAFLFPTLRDVLVISSPAKVSEGEPVVAEEVPFPHAPMRADAIDKAEINNLGQLLLLSLTGLLVAGWFLSRAFVLALFLLGGMTEVVYQMALQRGMVGPRLGLARVLVYAAGFAISMLIVVYIMLLILNRMQ